jgi:hypothetical protein
MTGCSYAHLNLRFNPFGTLTPEEEAAAALPDLDASFYAARLRRPGTAIQFLGPSGRGKTSHLMALRGHAFPMRPTYTLGAASRRRPSPRPPSSFVDEMQRVPRRQRQALFARHALHTSSARTWTTATSSPAPGWITRVIALGAVTATAPAG